jgi:hypothetical protein
MLVLRTWMFAFCSALLAWSSNAPEREIGEGLPLIRRTRVMVQKTLRLGAATERYLVRPALPSKLVRELEAN